MWRMIMRIIRGRRGARSWDATVTAPIELADVLMHDRIYQNAARDLQLRQDKAQNEAEQARREAREREQQEADERERRWRKMTDDERRAIAEAPNVTPMRRRAR